MKLQASLLVFGWVLFVAAGTPLAQGQSGDFELSAATKSRCVSILNEAIHDEDFPTAIHAAEALTRAGRGRSAARGPVLRKKPSGKKTLAEGSRLSLFWRRSTSGWTRRLGAHGGAR